MRSAQCERLLRIVTHSYNLRDTLINATLLALELILLVLATSRGELSQTSVFWLPFALFVSALQFSAYVLTGDAGFSMVWCSTLDWCAPLVAQRRGCARLLLAVVRRDVPPPAVRAARRRARRARRHRR